MTIEELTASLDRGTLWANRLNASPLLKKLVATGITILLEGGSSPSDEEVISKFMRAMMRSHSPLVVGQLRLIGLEGVKDEIHDSSFDDTDLHTGGPGG